MAQVIVDPREAIFLASQAERLSTNKRQQANSAVTPGFANANDNDNEPRADRDANADGAGSKEKSHQFWKSFRSLCSEFQSQIDSLLLVPSSPGTGTAEDNKLSNDSENAKAKKHYATAARRNEGRLKLDSILRNVRSLQRHVLSSSSIAGNDDAIYDGGDELLRSILTNPTPEVTQTDVRLISQEIASILKRIDAAREVICPKEKFVFRRYRRAMEERKRSGGGTLTESAEPETENDYDLNEEKKEGESEKGHDNKLRSRYGGVLENKSDCTVEVSSDGTLLVDKTAEDRLGFYGGPRPVDALHPTSPRADRRQRQPDNAQEASSYLLRNLRNVTVLVHGARPSLHLQRIENCRVYVTEPTLGPVHVTECRSSEIRCSCYQLRVHDSKDVEFHVWTRSGPIIEDCSGMAFGGDYYLDHVAGSAAGPDRNMFWDVKDFNWLRALRKSPNFVVIEKPAKMPKDSGSTDEGSMRNGEERCAPKPVEQAEVQKGDDDSEDEL